LFALDSYVEIGSRNQAPNEVTFKNALRDALPVFDSRHFGTADTAYDSSGITLDTAGTYLLHYGLTLGIKTPIAPASYPVAVRLSLARSDGTAVEAGDTYLTFRDSGTYQSAGKTLIARVSAAESLTLRAQAETADGADGSFLVPAGDSVILFAIRIADAS
jgi:hypothetical protein